MTQKAGETAWSLLQTLVDDDDPKELVASFLLRAESGSEFVVTISGHGKSPGHEFVQALLASANYLVLASGGELIGARPLVRQ